MPLVFVHGVSVRKDGHYAINETTRNGLFRQFALKDVARDPSKVPIENPYWGQFGASLAFGSASLPDEKFQEFGAGGTVFEGILTELASDIQAPAQDQVLTTLARTSLSRAVDCLWTAGAFTDAVSDVQAGGALAELSEKALSYAQSNPAPDWLKAVSDDHEFVEKLLGELEKSGPKGSAAESFGISDVWDHLKTTVSNIINAATGFVVNPAVRAVRPWVNDKVSIFLGDVFIYLRTRDESGAGSKIITEVLSTFERADRARTDDDKKLIIVAHSMGGNISYDVLTSYAPKLRVDLLVTVGSQVGLFEELKLFKNSDEGIRAPSVVEKPANVDKWINVMDPSDVLAYSISRIFSGTLDTTFDNQAPTWSAHSAYFYRPLFHQRLKARILSKP